MSDPKMAAALDSMAQRPFVVALKRKRCGELLAGLFDGDGVTLTPDGLDFVLIPADLMAQLGEGSDDDVSTD